MQRQRVLQLAGLLLVVLSIGACSLKPIKPIANGQQIGVVLLHGKGGDTQWIDPLASSLKNAGVQVLTPIMPWHRDRIYDKSFDDAMAEISRHVKELRAQGATSVFLAGHSLGAVAIAGYGARFDDIQGIILLAPGHFTAWPKFHEHFVEDLAKADKLIQDGKGDEKSAYHDMNAGKMITRFVTANVYKSWFADDGPAEFTSNMSKLKPTLPVLYIAGSNDRISQTKNKQYAYAKAPKNPNSHFVIIESDHLDVPDKSDEIVIEWLRKLHQ